MKRARKVHVFRVVRNGRQRSVTPEPTLAMEIPPGDVESLREKVRGLLTTRGLQPVGVSFALDGSIHAFVSEQAGQTIQPIAGWIQPRPPRQPKP